MINQTLWIGTSAILVGLVVRAINTDGMAGALTALRGGTPTSVPPGLLPWLALFFGGASATLNAEVNGADWQTALAGGLVSAATAALGHSLGKTIPGVRAVVSGRSSRLGGLLLLVGALFAGGASTGCPTGPSSPTVDAEAGIALVEAGGPVVTSICDLIEGVDPSGAVRSVCATVEEIIQAVGYILTLRSADAGAPPACQFLPHTTMCATSSERFRAIGFITQARAARFMLDGGAR